jgi:capsule polysaccharide export protein KpsE/RkpR
MKRTFLIVFLGLVGGFGAHFGWLAMADDPQPGASLGSQLAWMKTSLHLDEAQLARIQALHEASAPRLLALAAQVEWMRGELDAFEKTRQTEGRIDFLEFARFVDERRRLDHECQISTEQLVAQAAEVMTPQQRAQYLSLLEPALRELRANPSG